MSILTVADINTAVNHEPRIMDLRLAEALGFDDKHKVRALIARHTEALNRFGVVSATVAETSAKGGRPGTTFWLNLRQALYLATKSEAENAVDLTVEMVDLFASVKEGRLPKPKTAVAVVKAKTPALRIPAKRRPGKFETGSDILKDLVNVVRSAMYRVEHGSSPSFDRALHETLEDIQARKERPTAKTRGVLLDHDYDRAHDDLVAKLKAEGRDVKPRYRPMDRTDEVATRIAH